MSYDTDRLKQPSKIRKPEYDLIRIVAILQVIILHSMESAFIKSLCSSCVILFVMLSGSLKLDISGEFSRKRWMSSLVKIAVSFVVTSILYAVFVSEKVDTMQLLKNIAVGYYHLWFLYMIFGLYLCIPIILQIKQNAKVYRLFVGICLVTAIIVPSVTNITGYTGLEYIVYELVRIDIGLEYIIYFVLGDLLSGREYRYASIIIAVCLGIAAKIISSFVSVPPGDLNIGQMLYACMWFVLLLVLGRNLPHSDRLIRVMAYISKQCFIVYLVHAAVIVYLQRAGVQDSLLVMVLTVLISFVFAVLFNIVVKFAKNKWRLLYAD